MANDAHKVKYRRLEIGEVIEAGDEYQSEETKIWTRVPTVIVGKVIDLDHLPLRRLCLCGAQQRQNCDLPDAGAELPEQVALLWASVGDILGRVVRIEGEIDGFKAEAEEAAPPQPDPASPAEGFRTERVTLEVTQRSESYTPLSEFDWDAMLRSASRGRLFEGESVRVVEETEAMRVMTKLRRERDAARAEIGRLRARVAELEAAKEAKGGRLPDMVAWITAERDAARAEAERLRDRVAELEAAARTAALLAEVRESEWRVASDLAAEANAENAGGEAKQEPEPPSSDEAIAHNATLDALAAARESLAAANRGIARLAAERDAAKEECGRLRHLLKTKESECETHHPWVHPSAAPAANAGGDSNPLHATAETLTEREQTGVAAKQEPVGYGVRTEWGQFRAGLYTSPRAPANLERGDEVVPLYAAPSPRGWLTEEERDAVDHAADIIEDMEDDDGSSLKRKADVLRSLRARETPPRVKVPTWMQDDVRRCVIAAIRAAGGEVDG